MKFRTAYSESVRFPSPSGSRLRTIYQRKVTANGSELIEVGKEDVYDSIQKAGLGLGIDDLIRRAEAGDTNAIGAPVDSYVDLTHVPKDMLEAHQMLADARASYNSLPADLRAKFGNSFESFLKVSADGSALQFLSSQKAEAAPGVSPLSPEEITKLRNSLIGGNSNA